MICLTCPTTAKIIFKRFPLIEVSKIIVGVFYLYKPWSSEGWLRSYNGFFDLGAFVTHVKFCNQYEN